MLYKQELAFIKESNAIEGINREPTGAEIKEFNRFIDLKEVKVSDLQKFVSVYQPGNVLREKSNLNVRIGGQLAPLGGKQIREKLKSILHQMPMEGAYNTHVDYELLHAFTDGNGRSGRALWYWQMSQYTDDQYFRERGFRHTFYYQSLSEARIKKDERGEE